MLPAAAAAVAVIAATARWRHRRDQLRDLLVPARGLLREGGHRASQVLSLLPHLSTAASKEGGETETETEHDTTRSGRTTAHDTA